MLEKLFNPKAVAIIGASQTEGKVGHALLKNMIEEGFEGGLYAVNPKVGEIMGVKCYPDVKSLPDGIDLAVIAIPAKVVPQTIEDCGTFPDYRGLWKPRNRRRGGHLRRF